LDDSATGVVEERREDGSPNKQPFSAQKERRKGRMMKRVMGLSLALLLLSGTRGRAADTFEALLKDMISATKQVVGELEKIKDEDTAKTARPILKKLGAQLQDIQQRAKKLGKPPEEEEKKLKEKYEKELTSLFQKMTAESIRVAKVKGGPEALKELQPPPPTAPKDKPTKDAEKKDKPSDKTGS
jgi:hypothetical protein